MITRKQIKEMVEKKLSEIHAEPGGRHSRPPASLGGTSLTKTPSGETAKSAKDALEAAVKALNDNGNLQAAATIERIIARIARIGNK